MMDFMKDAATLYTQLIHCKMPMTQTIEFTFTFFCLNTHKSLRQRQDVSVSTGEFLLQTGKRLPLVGNICTD